MQNYRQQENGGICIQIVTLSLHLTFDALRQKFGVFDIGANDIK